MRITTLIRTLQDIHAKEGDIDVELPDGTSAHLVTIVEYPGVQSKIPTLESGKRRRAWKE